MVRGHRIYWDLVEGVRDRRTGKVTQKLVAHLGRDEALRLKLATSRWLERSARPDGAEWGLRVTSCCGHGPAGGRAAGGRGAHLLAVGEPVPIRPHPGLRGLDLGLP